MLRKLRVAEKEKDFDWYGSEFIVNDDLPRNLVPCQMGQSTWTIANINDKGWVTFIAVTVRSEEINRKSTFRFNIIISTALVFLRLIQCR